MVLTCYMLASVTKSRDAHLALTCHQWRSLDAMPTKVVHSRYISLTWVVCETGTSLDITKHSAGRIKVGPIIVTVLLSEDAADADLGNPPCFEFHVTSQRWLETTIVVSSFAVDGSPGLRATFKACSVRGEVVHTTTAGTMVSVVIHGTKLTVANDSNTQEGHYCP